MTFKTVVCLVLFHFTMHLSHLPPGQSGLGAILQAANEFHTNLLSQAPEDSQIATRLSLLKLQT